MSKTLLLQGFVITPQVHIVDLDDGTIEPCNLGGNLVTRDEFPKYLEEQWPAMFETLKAAFAQQEQNIATAEAPNRAARRRQATKGSTRGINPIPPKAGLELVGKKPAAKRAPVKKKA